MTGGRFALVGGTVALPGRLESGLAVVCVDGQIDAVVPAHAVGDQVDTIDVGGRLVAPGLIDLHTHGALGRSFAHTTREAWDVIRLHLARHGVTSALASVATAGRDDLARSLAFHREYDHDAAPGATVLGVHLEGPFLAPEQRGAHSAHLLRIPEADDVDWLLATGDALRMITVAPELPGALDLVRRLATAGVIVAAGHSRASDQHLRAAADAGLRHVTHLWSGQSGLTKDGPWRIPGLVEAALASDGLTAEIIADGRHLPPALLRIADRCFGDRLCVVSDASDGTGLPEGTTYRIGDTDCRVGDGVGVVVGADSLAGSVTPLDTMIRHLIVDLAWPVPEVVAMVTQTPAGVLGLGHRKGRIATGYDADLVILDDDYAAWATLAGGTWIHRPEIDLSHRLIVMNQPG